MEKTRKLVLSLIGITCSIIGSHTTVHASHHHNQDPLYQLLHHLNRMATHQQQRQHHHPRTHFTHMRFFNDPFFNDPFFNDDQLERIFHNFFHDDDETHVTYIIHQESDNQQQVQVPRPPQQPQAPNQNRQQQPRVRQRRYVTNGQPSLNGFLPPYGGGYNRVDPRFSHQNRPQNEYDPDTEKNKMTFKDVLGQDGAIKEISQVVDFLKNPKKYHELGADIPKGILLEGPPGCGKTLLARAVAGEAKRPFIHATGSQFVNKYVGTGADNIRKLFEQARQQAPSILFIDEIDAIGSRETDENQEYRHTINQLLSEMDGFMQSDVIVIAATNFAKALDKALTRPGRFDRVIRVGFPNKKGRYEILRHYFAKIKLDTATSAETLAAEFAPRTPGFSGADCKKLANEAALEACADNATQITATHFEQAFDKMTLGLKNDIDRTKKQLWEAAVHEAGHTFIRKHQGLSVPKVTILPRGDALGVTHMKEKYEAFADYSKKELIEKIMVFQAGPAAEKVLLSSKNPGGRGDHEQAYKLASIMVRECGLGDGEIEGLKYDKHMSEVWKSKFDQEIARIIQESRISTEKFVSQHRDSIEKLAKALHKHETMIEEEIDAVLAQA